MACRFVSAIFENPRVIALRDAFPVNRGHALIIPRRHVPTWVDATAEERAALSSTQAEEFVSEATPIKELPTEIV